MSSRGQRRFLRNVPADSLNVTQDSPIIVGPQELTSLARSLGGPHLVCFSENPDLLGTGEGLASSKPMTHPIDHQIIAGTSLRLIEDE
jgi:hypothetical protein